MAKPILASEFSEAPKYASYYYWHMVSIVNVFIAVCFVLSGLGIASTDLTVDATILAALFTARSIVLTVWKAQRLMTLPK
ncbi:MAG: hypothetical protein AAF541_23590 [Pseudomonadota bacterium]